MTIQINALPSRQGVFRENLGPFHQIDFSLEHRIEPDIDKYCIWLLGRVCKTSNISSSAERLDFRR